tara:strand:- start:494 stop:1861 length:1368 start_codon:yes stop_codon:yes gene_type:complete
MSSQSLLKFLKKLDKELKVGATKNKPASQAYRESTGNKKTSTLTYTPKAITEALTNLTEIPAGLKKDYDTLVDGLTASIREDFKNKAKELNAKNKGDAVVRGNKFSVSIMIVKRGTRDNYNLLKSTYEKRLDTFYTDFLSLINKPGGLERYSSSAGKDIKLSRGKVFGQTHQGGANIYHMVNDAVFKALNHTAKNSTKASEDIIKDLKALKNQDTDVILSMINDGPKEEVRLGIESQLINAQTGGGIEEQGLKQNLDAALKNLIQFLKTTPGSDSIVEGQRKRIIKEIVKPFKNKKGITVKHENTKLKNTKSPTKLTKKGGKTEVIKGAAVAIGAKKRPARQKEKTRTPRMGIKNILGVLNNQLPERVAGNMGEPRLVNRTGRFAQSVRATDVSQTQQGFPSIGYTYEKGRYGVFESTSGTSRASIERDPRPLIDQSIREIVIGFGLGRIYTRRQ